MSQPKLPVIVDPYSRFEDEVAGETADEIAHNMAGSLRVSLAFAGGAFRCKLRRRPLTLNELRNKFRGHKLTEESKALCLWVAAVWNRAKPPEKDDSTTLL